MTMHRLELLERTLATLYEKCAFFEKELIISASPTLQFEMKTRIAELRAQIDELEAEKMRLESSASLGEVAFEEYAANDFKRLLRERMSLSEVRIIWASVFGTRLDDDFPGRNLAESVDELHRRAAQRQRLPILFEEIRRERPDIE